MATSTLATSTLLQGRCAPDLIPQGTRGRRATTTTPYPARAPSAAWTSCGATGRPACGDGARRDGAYRRIQQVRHMASWGPHAGKPSVSLTDTRAGGVQPYGQHHAGRDQHTYDAGVAHNEANHARRPCTTTNTQRTARTGIRWWVVGPRIMQAVRGPATHAHVWPCVMGPKVGGHRSVGTRITLWPLSRCRENNARA